MTDSGIYWKTSDTQVFPSEEAAREHERVLRVRAAIKSNSAAGSIPALSTSVYIVKNALPLVKALRLTDGWPKEFNADGTERFYELVPHYRNGKFYNRKFYKGGEVLGFKQRKNE